MSGEDILATNVIEGFDFNNDGVGDVIYVEIGGESPDGNIHADYIKYIPQLGGEQKDVYLPFDRQDPCFFREDLKKLVGKIKDGIPWLYTRPEPFFYDRTGNRFFSAGQRVWMNGKIDEIAGFRVTVKSESNHVQTSNVEIVLKDCQSADFSNVSWVTPSGERLDQTIIAAIAAGTGNAKMATKVERKMAAIFAEIKKQHHGDLKVAAMILESKISSTKDSLFKGIGKDWRLMSLLSEGLKKFLTNTK